MEKEGLATCKIIADEIFVFSCAKTDTDIQEEEIGGDDANDEQNPWTIDEDDALLFDEEGAAHASFVSRAECGWYNQLRNVGIEAASTLSSCVPDNFVFVIKANEYHWDMFMYGLQNVKKCARTITTIR